MMYLKDITALTKEEIYIGPFDRITLDSVTDKGFTFLCNSPEYGTGRFSVRTIEIVENLQEDM